MNDFIYRNPVFLTILFAVEDIDLQLIYYYCLSKLSRMAIAFHFSPPDGNAKAFTGNSVPHLTIGARRYYAYVTKMMGAPSSLTASCPHLLTKMPEKTPKNDQQGSDIC